MARASRSNKKQPAFDPGELQDLIFSPAVGTGVGSHLLGTTEHFPAPIERQGNNTYNASTVDTSSLRTIAITDLATVIILGDQRTRAADSIVQEVPIPPKVLEGLAQDLSTVVISDPPTVDTLTTSARQDSSPLNSMASERTTTVDRQLQSTVVASYVSTVDNGASSSESVVFRNRTPNEHAPRAESELEQGREEISSETPSREVLPNLETVAGLAALDSAIQLKRPPRELVLWISEQGDLVPQGRVKRIRLAQDVINSAEESVYDTLWTAKIQTGEREASRVVQAGYDYLVKRTRLSKKTIQRIVAKLIDKDFIAIERPADIYQRTSTVYRVFSYKAVLDHHLQRGRCHVAKIGPGFSYVRPMEDPRRSSSNSAQLGPIYSATQAHLSTVDTSDTSTVVKTVTSPLANRAIDTVPELDASTVVRETTTFIGNSTLGNRTPSSSAIYQVLNKYGTVDDDIVDRLIKNCKQQAPDCTEEEIIHFIEEKGSLVRVKDSRIYSPIGFLLTAVPKCLSGEAFRFHREEEMKRREAEAAHEARRQTELDEWRRDQEAQLADPLVSEQDKLFIREWLGIR